MNDHNPKVVGYVDAPMEDVKKGTVRRTLIEGFQERDEMFDKALKQSTLARALTVVAIWESDRATHQALANAKAETTGVSGQLWETCFEALFIDMIERYNK